MADANPDPDGVMTELLNKGKDGSRRTRLVPAPRPAPGEPRLGGDSGPQASTGTAVLDRGDDPRGAEVGEDLAAQQLPPSSSPPPASPGLALAEAPAREAAPPTLAPAPEPEPIPAPAPAAAMPLAPAPAVPARGPVNVHARIQAPDNDRMERVIRGLRRLGWPTNKVEIIGMLVHELPEPAGEALAERLLAYRRDILNATAGDDA